MIDGHIHMERGEYTLDWLRRYVNQAIRMRLSEIRLLEHCYLFPEFLPMYDDLRANNAYVDQWLGRKAGRRSLNDFLALIDAARRERFPLAVKFGLEICYFEGYEPFVWEITKNMGLDFLLGSVHYIDHFAFDHKQEHWRGIAVDDAYTRYFERSLRLAQCGLFDGIAHPDAIGLFGHKPTFSLTDTYASLADALAENGLYAEENSGVARRCPDTAFFGMNPELLKALLRRGVPIVTASDAHRVEDIGDGVERMQAIIDAARGEQSFVYS